MKEITTFLLMLEDADVPDDDTITVVADVHHEAMAVAEPLSQRRKRRHPREPAFGVDVEEEDAAIVEQENIDYFQATTPGPPSSAPTYKSSFRLRNDDALQPKHFRLTYDPQVPAGWQVTVNGGQLDLDLTPGEVRTIPATIDPGGASSPPAGTIYWVDIDARYERELTNPTLPPGLQKHLEFRPLGGVRIESRVVRPVKVKC